MAVAQFSFVTLPNPTEAALKWVEMARMGSKAWTDACLQIVTTFSEAAQTQAKALRSLTPTMVAPVEAPPALAEPLEALAAAVETSPALMESPPAPVESQPAPVPASLVRANIETPPALVAKAQIEPTPVPVTPPVAKVRVEPLTAPAPVVKAAPAAAKSTKPAAKKKT
jgi:hypothetical protein